VSLWREAGRAVPDDTGEYPAGNADHNARESGGRVAETENLGRQGTMIAHYLPYLLVGIACGSSGALLMAMLASGKRPVAWVVQCAQCGHEVPHTGHDRRQLHVELWDTYGMLYAKYPVGEGEDLRSQPVGPWLTAALKQQVENVNAMQARAAGKLQVVK
jgi:hypothetical protein